MFDNMGLHELKEFLAYVAPRARRPLWRATQQENVARAQRSDIDTYIGISGALRRRRRAARMNIRARARARTSSSTRF